MKNNRISIIFHTLLISADILMPEKPRTEPVQFCDKHNFVTPAAQNVMRKSLIYGFSHFSFSNIKINFTSYYQTKGNITNAYC